jgi:hypothetical protein
VIGTDVSSAVWKSRGQQGVCCRVGAGSPSFGDDHVRMGGLHPGDGRLVGGDGCVCAGIRPGHIEGHEDAAAAGGNQAGAAAAAAAARKAAAGIASCVRADFRRAGRADVLRRSWQSMQRSCHLPCRLLHLRVIGEGEPGGGRSAGLDEDALGWRGHHIQLAQDLPALPGLARVVLRQTLRSQQLACQKRRADQAAPAEHRCLPVPGAPAGGALH